MDYSHHALLLQVNDVVNTDISSLLQSSVEYRTFSYEQCKVEDARELVRLAHQRPDKEEVQTFVVRTNFITLDAQHTLLKVLEEPPPSTKFILVLPQQFPLLQTLRSRLFDVTDNNKQSEAVVEFEDFISQSISDRLAQIDKAAKGDDKDWMQAIKQGLVFYLQTGAKENATQRQRLEMVARLLLTRGSANKMLLEQLALVVPLASKNEKR